MLTIFFIAVFLTFHTQANSQGYNGCVDKGWTYHGHTHTCVKWMKKDKKWTEAQAHCHTFKGGTQEAQTPGRLARIDDGETNDFLNKFQEASWDAWIGLHYVNQINAYQWDGFPDETTRFYNMKDTGKDYTKSEVYVSLHGSGTWRLKDDKIEIYYYCQHDARIEETRITCPTAPIEENANITDAVTVRFHFNHWDKIEWYLDTKDKTVVSCLRWLNLCASDSVGYVANVSDDGLATLSLTGWAVSRPETTWVFNISHTVKDKNQLHETKSCSPVAIYASPSPLSCSVQLLSSEIQVACQTDRVFPQASCDWSYKNEDDVGFSPVNHNQVNHQLDNPFKESKTGNLYYRSNCSVSLTPDKTTIKAGRLTVRISVYPNVSGNNLSQTPGAVQMKEEVVNIVPPKQPTFWSSTKTGSNSDPIRLSYGDDLTLACRIASGTPEVMSTHMACDFPFMESGESTDSVPGTLYNKTLTVNTAMNGKTCQCWGSHISGDMKDATLTFTVKRPATVTQFTANRQNHSVVDLNTQVNILCQAAGVPAPVTTLSKKEFDNAFAVVKSVRGETLEKSFQAKCSHNGRYVCRALNTVDGSSQESSLALSLQVRCLPTLCDQEGQTPQKTVYVGRQFELTMCVDGYPIPVLANFKLQKDTGDSTWGDVTLPNDAINLVTDDHSLTNVIINFGQLTSTQLGQYRLLYRANEVSKLHFSLSAPAEDGDSSNIIVAVGVTLSVCAIITVIVILIIIIYFKRRKRIEGKSNGQAILPLTPGTDQVPSMAEPTQQTNRPEVRSLAEPVYLNAHALQENANSVEAEGFIYTQVGYRAGVPAASATPERDEDGLIYAKLDFGPSKATGLPAPKKPSQAKPQPQLHETTEYVDISAVATQQAKSNLEKQEQLK